MKTPSQEPWKQEVLVNAKNVRRICVVQMRKWKFLVLEWDDKADAEAAEMLAPVEPHPESGWMRCVEL